MLQRLSLFLLLVVAVPWLAYWWSHDFERVDESARRFVADAGSLRGGRSPVTDVAPGETRPGEKLATATQPGKTEPGPDGTKPPEGKAPVEGRPETPEEDPRERAERLFLAGTFEEAEIAFSGVDEYRRSLALLGLAFQSAFPENVPDRPYVKIKTTTGSEYEGFATESGGMLKLEDITGKSFAFPKSAISHRRRYDKEKALDRIAERVRADGTSDKVTGPRLFALIQAACKAGRPDAAAPLLDRALALDGEKPFFLSSVKSRVPPEFQNEIYRAFATCQAPRIVANEAVVKAPLRLNGRRNGSSGRQRYNPRGPAVKDARAKALMTEARPLRKKAEKLYRKIILDGLDHAKPQEVDEAIDLFDKAIAKYEKAVLIEETDPIYAILRKCSRLRFTLGFIRQQLEGR